jgi:hypothetical protein
MSSQTVTRLLGPANSSFKGGAFHNQERGTLRLQKKEWRTLRRFLLKRVLTQSCGNWYVISSRSLAAPI